MQRLRRLSVFGLRGRGKGAHHFPETAAKDRSPAVSGSLRLRTSAPQTCIRMNVTGHCPTQSRDVLRVMQFGDDKNKEDSPSQIRDTLGTITSFQLRIQLRLSPFSGHAQAWVSEKLSLAAWPITHHSYHPRLQVPLRSVGTSRHIRTSSGIPAFHIHTMVGGILVVSAFP